MSKNIVDTNSGKVRGYTRNGIFTFKGMPYGLVTPVNRFMAALKPKPWAGVRNSMAMGPVCPQSLTNAPEGRRAGWSRDEEAFMFEWSDGHPAEDCLRINVWTSSINDNRKRPVMVWIHGGIFEFGSGEELPAYDGENLARRGDVVVITLNHRIGALGFLNLMEYGEQWVDSANVGMLDLVAALQWVHDNVANFGGDPGRVMIFGQSGGGAKVTTLMAMPGAKGLFHRASVQSGSMLRQQTPDQTAEISNSVQAGDPTLDGLPIEKIRLRLTAQRGDKADAILETFRGAHPKATPYELFSIISGTAARVAAIAQAERKAALGAAPAYNWWFQWQTPVLDGKARAFHTAELAFCFYNTNRCAGLTGGGPRPQAVAAKVADAWVAFARNGDPNHPGLPHWPKFTVAECPTMIFDDQCVMRNNPDKLERGSLGA